MEGSRQELPAWQEWAGAFVEKENCLLPDPWTPELIRAPWRQKHTQASATFPVCYSREAQGYEASRIHREMHFAKTWPLVKGAEKMCSKK